MAVVETRGVRKVFVGDTPAVDGIDIATEEGEYLVLLGPSGSGKTTLLRMIAGLERPSQGDVLIGGRVVNDLPPRARRIAMVFQSYALYPHKTVSQNISFPLAAAGMPKERRPERIRWASDLLGINELLDRKPRQLSGGERQRVARALVREPQVFLLDEPLSNLDAKLRTSAREDLKEFQRRVGVTTIYVTHDQVEAMGLGDRIAVLDKGRLQQLGTPPEIYHEPANTFVATFLGSPPMNLLEHDGALVGFRPEHFLPEGLVSEREGRVPFEYQVDRVEYLGSDRMLYGTIPAIAPGVKVIARLPFTVTTPVAATRPRERNRRYLLEREGILGPLLLLPSVAYLLALVAFPLVMAILYAFTDITTGKPVLHFVGIDTFKAALSDPVTRTSLRNTVVFTLISQVLVVVLSVVLAFALRVNFRGKWIARFLILLPWTTPIALGTIAWLWMLDSIFSPIDWVLSHVGITSPGSHMFWLGRTHLAMGSVIAVQAWRMLPLATVILLAGLTSIPQDVREAAEIDGAGFWRRMVGIEIPLLLPITAVALLFGLVFSFTDMTVVFVLTRGGPQNATQVLASWAFFRGIEGGSLGEGAAVAVFMFPVLAGLAALILRMVSRAEVS